MSSIKSDRTYQLQYHYIIFGSKTYYSIAWNDVIDNKDVQYIDSLTSGQTNWLLQLLVRIGFNLKLNKWIPSTIRTWIYRHAFHFETSNKPICFLFFECWYAVYTTEFIAFLRHTYPYAKCVLYLQDLVKSNPLFNIATLRTRFDKIYSYDKQDALTYNLSYLPTPYSAMEGLDVSSIPAYDLFFCGYAKNRLFEIMDVYDQAKKAGKSCLFYITGVKEDQKRAADDIIYNQPIGYTDYLKKAAQARCIVEVMQHGADGFTPRLWEAITYNKHLLTNNESIKNSNYAHQDIHYINNHIHWDWIQTTASFPIEWKKQISPLVCLNKIEEQLV